MRKELTAAAAIALAAVLACTSSEDRPSAHGGVEAGGSSGSGGAKIEPDAKVAGDGSTGPNTSVPDDAPAVEGAPAADGAPADGPAVDPDGPAVDPDAGPIDPAVACADYASAFCERYPRCRASWLRLFYGTIDTCKKRLSLSCVDRFTAPGSRETPADLARCAREIASSECMPTSSAATLKVLPSCSMTGTLPDGSACKYGPQCQSGLCRLTGFCGICDRKKQAGEGCTESIECSGDLVCTTRQRRCVGVVGEGSACPSEGPVCKGELSCTGGMCSTLKRLGETCDATVSNCNGSEDGFCKYVGAGAVCVQRRYVGAGENCSPTDQVLCAGGAMCRLGPGNTEPGTCVGPAADGQPCDPSADLDCVLPALCSNGGRCELPPPAQDCR